MKQSNELAGLAFFFPENLLIEQLEESIKEYKKDPNAKTKSMLGFSSLIVSMKFSIAESMESVVDFMNHSEEINKTMDLLNPNKN